jgi:hypothetical protein
MIIILVLIFWVEMGISLSNLSAVSVMETLLVVRVSLHVLLALSRCIIELVVMVIVGVIMIGVSMVVMISEIFIIKVKTVLFQDTHWSKGLMVKAILVVFLAAGVFTIMIKIHSRDTIFL